MTRTDKKNTNRKLTEETVLSYHKRHQEGEPIVSLAKELNVTGRTLRTRFIAANLEYRKLISTKNINRRYYQNINSELKAYSLGFIAGDGSIKTSGRVNALNIDIQERDAYILTWIRDAVSPDIRIAVIPEKGNQVERRKVTITSYHIIKDLEDKGIISNKSYLPFSFNNVPLEMERHVVRGLLDADGCIFKYKSGRVIANIVSTSLPLLEQVSQWLLRENVHNIIHTATSKKTQLYKLGIYSKEGIVKLKEYLYKESTYFMTRKYNKICCDNTELTKVPNKTLAV